MAGADAPVRAAYEARIAADASDGQPVGEIPWGHALALLARIDVPEHLQQQAEEAANFGAAIVANLKGLCDGE